MGIHAIESTFGPNDPYLHNTSTGCPLPEPMRRDLDQRSVLHLAPEKIDSPENFEN